MSLLSDDLSVWEIAFRWAGYDPGQIRLRVPLPVRDNFRVLLDAILCDHLPCISLFSEKYDGDDPEEARFYIRHWLDDVYAGIAGHTFNRKLLKWAHVERWAFQQWCERRSIPLPEFWFPPGWALEYEWPEEALVAAESDTASEAVAPEKSDLEPSSENSAATTPSLGNTVDGDNVPSIVEMTSKEVGMEKLLENQRRTIAAQVVAVNLWKKHPDMTIAAMVKHDVIQELCGGQFQAPEVVRRWLRAVAPAAVKERRGRPRSKKGTADD